VDSGVIGGGSTRDVTDHHCKELYRCYKCVTIDYLKNYTDVSYTVDFTKDDNGNRLLNCGVNSKQDAENICECDRRYAENIAATQDKCTNGAEPDMDHGDFCLDEKYRTTTGDGEFNPRLQCDKQNHNHDKDRCCGIYPNRYPYDTFHKNCCRTKQFDHDSNQIEVFGLMPNNGMCEEAGGDVVVSVDGDPHHYVNANQQ